MPAEGGKSSPVVPAQVEGILRSTALPGEAARSWESLVVARTSLVVAPRAAPRAGRCHSTGAGQPVVTIPGSMASAMTGVWEFALGCFAVAAAVGFQDSIGDPESGPPASCVAVSSVAGLATSAFPWTCPKTVRDC